MQIPFKLSDDHNYPRLRLIVQTLLRGMTTTDRRYHFTEQQIQQISAASLFHDAGKCAIPQKLLNKKGKLTPAELAVVRQHAPLGIAVLQFHRLMSKDGKNPPFLYDICRYHHERWDGKGYPDGLRGDEIPVAAQVMAIADVYDSLRTDRPYRPAFTHKEALQIILADHGHFAPAVLSSFLAQEKQLAELHVGISSRVEVSALDNVHLASAIGPQITASGNDKSSEGGSKPGFMTILEFAKTRQEAQKAPNSNTQVQHLGR